VAMIQQGLVESVHDCADGGLAVAIAECAFPAAIGAGVAAASNGLPPEFVLFGEDASRVLLSCDLAYLPRIQQIAADPELFADVLGETGGDRLEIRIDGQVVVSAPVAELNDAYEGALEKALRTEAAAVASE